MADSKGGVEEFDGAIIHAKATHLWLSHVLEDSSTAHELASQLWVDYQSIWENGKHGWQMLVIGPFRKIHINVCQHYRDNVV